MADLRSLRRRMDEKKRLLQEQQRIRQNIDTMERLLPELETEAAREQEDVERMESGGITSFFYNVIGKSEEKLEKERREAWEAQTKYQEALRTLQNLYKENEDISAALALCGDVEAEYKKAFSEKRQMLLNSSGAAGQKLRALEEDARQLKALAREIQEARSAGNLVLDQVAEIEKTLQGASNWGMVDMFSDSFISDMAKYGKLDEAKRLLRDLNRLLADYRRELKDLNVNMNISADIGGGMQFADIFFDNIFTDSMTLSRIDNIKRQVRDIRYQVERHGELVERKRQSVTSTLSQKRKEAEQVIIDG